MPQLPAESKARGLCACVSLLHATRILMIPCAGGAAVLDARSHRLRLLPVLLLDPALPSLPGPYQPRQPGRARCTSLGGAHVITLSPPFLPLSILLITLFLVSCATRHTNQALVLHSHCTDTAKYFSNTTPCLHCTQTTLYKDNTAQRLHCIFATVH
jgi:hypothetical protein